MVCSLKLFAIAALWLSAQCANGEKIVLNFSYITTKTGSFVAAGAIPVVDLALEQINNRTDILPNYTLTYTTILDSKCNGTASLDAFMEHFRNVSEPTYVSLFCCGCSSADISVAEVSHYWNVPQMAGIAGADELNDRTRFRGFYRTDASSEFVGHAVAEMARQFNWTQMAIISRSESLFTMIAESLNSIFESEGRILDSNITIDKNVDGESFPYNLIHNLGKRDYRIIVLNTIEEVAYTVLCEAYHLGWLPPRYVWFTYSWYSEGWWNAYNGNSSCTPEIITKILNDSLTISPNNNLVSDDRQQVAVSGFTPDDYEREYRKRLKEERYRAQNLSEFILAGSEYDAIWATAIGLHNASERVSRNESTECDHLPGELVPLENFDYLNERMGCVLRNSFQGVSFRGITGPVAFNSNGARDARVIRVQQFHVADNGSVERPSVAEVVVRSTNSSALIFKGDLSVTSLWPGGAPYDGAARERLHPNSLALVSIYSIAAIAGIAFGVFCLVFNIVFRNRKVVKLSSCNLNYLIVIGAILLYGSVFPYGFSERDHHDAAHDALCNVRQWLFSLGYTLCFAVILAKTWRVYHIFFNPKPKKKIPKDWLLFVIVVVVVAVDLLIILIGTVVPSARISATRVEDVQHPVSYDDGIRYNNYVFICLNHDAVVWLAISYAYKGLLQLSAMFMAFHTRTVKIKVLNDSKEIAVIVYVTSIILVLLAVVEFALNRYHEVYTGLFGLALLLEATVFLTLVFIPKMVHLFRDPDGETALDPSSAGDIDENTRSHYPMATKTNFTNHNNEVAGLKEQITRLEKELAKAGKKEE